MLNVITFRARFPEFSRLPESMVSDAIARGVAQVNQNVMGTLADEATGYLAAHFLALSPAGQQARLSEPGKQTTYYTHYMRLATLKSVGYGRVTKGGWCG